MPIKAGSPKNELEYLKEATEAARDVIARSTQTSARIIPNAMWTEDPRALGECMIPLQMADEVTGRVVRRREFLERITEVTLWQLAPDFVTYGERQNWWILVTPDGEVDIDGPWATKEEAEAVAVARNWKIVPIETHGGENGNG